METMTPEQAWEDAKKQAADDRENVVPDGTYTATTYRAEAYNAKSSGRAMLVLTLKILGPRATGRLVWHRHMLDRVAGWPFLAADLDKYGVDIDGVPSIEALEPHLGTMLDQEFEIAVKAAGEFVNVRLIKRVDGPGVVADGEGLPF